MKAVLFDFGGVITAPLGPMFAAVAADAGAAPAEVAALLVGSYDADDHPLNRLELGQGTFAEVCDWAREQGARRGWTLELAPMVSHLETIELRPTMLERAADLRRRGYRTAIVTNNFKEITALWRVRVDVDALFDTVVDSCEVGVRKPDPRIYHLTLDRLGGVAPEEAVLLDDFEANLAGARAIGMHGVYVGEDTDAALAELEALLAAEGA
ncbi:MAG: HAD family phosphatase [Actinobacteria bacterium]|nr:HAD family phosphatase [Actinomycetota bacterium]